MNLQPECGYLTHAPSFRGTARIVIVAIVVSATTGAGVLLSLVDRPLVTIGETSLAARMLARPFEPESAPVKTRQAAQVETQAVIEDWFVKPGAAKSDDGVLVPSEPSTNSPAEVPAPTAAMAELQTTGDTPPAMGSTHTYLSVMRLPEIARSTGVSFRWRPFHLLVILQEMKHVPFADKPAKSAYMWRDIERRAAVYGIGAKVPAPYPAKQSVVANLIAIVGMREGWGADFVGAAYRRWFQLAQETGSEPNVSGSLRDIGQDPQRVLALANAEEAKAALTAETDAARELCVFGSPTFAVGRELFWGDDRLDDAISWYRSGLVQRA